MVFTYSFIHTSIHSFCSVHRRIFERHLHEAIHQVNLSADSVCIVTPNVAILSTCRGDYFRFLFLSFFFFLSFSAVLVVWLVSLVGQFGWFCSCFPLFIYVFHFSSLSYSKLKELPLRAFFHLISTASHALRWVFCFVLFCFLTLFLFLNEVPWLSFVSCAL